MTAARSADDVLAFWFAEGRAEKWFAKDPGFDREVRTRLGPLYRQAAQGSHDGWRDSPAGCVALCILLDQVPRNLFRNEARAFATDAQALAVARDALAHGFDRDLPAGQCMFLYLPFEHSEALADQDLCVELVARLDGDPRWLDYARRHRDVVIRFGRFPHRNAVLGRASTAEELAFLAGPDSAF